MTKYITSNDILKTNWYIGDISIIKSTKNNIIDYELAKENAILIQITSNLYVDIEFINSIKDLETINELLINGSKDNNVLLSYGINNPYVGKLYTSNLKYTYENNKNIKKLIK